MNLATRNIATLSNPAFNAFSTMETTQATMRAILRPLDSLSHPMNREPKKPPAEKRPLMAPRISFVYAWGSASLGSCVRCKYEKKPGCPNLVVRMEKT